MGRERSGIRLLFLALFGVGLPGVVGNVVAPLAAIKPFALWRLSVVVVRLELAVSSPFAMGAAQA